MSIAQLNRQRVLNLLDSLSARDLEGTLDRCTEDVDFLTHAPIDVFPHLGPRRGRDQMREMWRTFLARYATIRYEVVQIIAEGDTVATNLRTFFTKSSNGRMVQVDIAVFFTFRDGRVAQIREIIDSYDLVQQVLERDIAPLITGETAE